MTGGLFDDDVLEELTADAPPATLDNDPKLDAIIARRRELERERNARRRGLRPSHRCPACGGRTFRRRRVYPSRGVVDDRCKRCAEHLDAWAEQNVDRAGVDAGLDDRPRCPVHVGQLAPCQVCADLLELELALEAG